jgi:hypothetical protein
LVVAVLALVVLALTFLGGIGLTLSLTFLGGAGFDFRGRSVILVRGAILGGEFLFFYFVPCRMQQKLENEPNKKEEDPVKRKREREPSKRVESR